MFKNASSKKAIIIASFFGVSSSCYIFVKIRCLGFLVYVVGKNF